MAKQQIDRLVERRAVQVNSLAKPGTAADAQLDAAERDRLRIAGWP